MVTVVVRLKELFGTLTKVSYQDKKKETETPIKQSFLYMVYTKMRFWIPCRT